MRRFEGRILSFRIPLVLVLAMIIVVGVVILFSGQPSLFPMGQASPGNAAPEANQTTDRSGAIGRDRLSQDEIAIIQHSYDPRVDYFIDIRNYDPGHWAMDFRQLMPNDGNDLIAIRSWQAVALEPDMTWGAGLEDLESGRTILKVAGSSQVGGDQTYTQTYSIFNPVFSNQVPVILDRPRQIFIYAKPYRLAEARLAARGDIRLANSRYWNYALREMGAMPVLPDGNANQAMKSDIVPWNINDYSTTSQEWVEKERVDLGKTRSFVKMGAFWRYWIDTAGDPNSAARIEYSADGINWKLISTKDNLPVGRMIDPGDTNHSFESIGVSNVTARYLRLSIKTGASGNASHTQVIKWFAWGV